MMRYYSRFDPAMFHVKHRVGRSERGVLGVQRGDHQLRP